EAQLEAARQSLTLLQSRFEDRVGCWSAVRAIGKNFPRSIESVLTELSYKGGQLRLSGISRIATIAEQLSGKLTEIQLFTDIEKEQTGPSFTLQATLAVKKAYQQWLDGNDNSDLEAIARDPFTSS